MALSRKYYPHEKRIERGRKRELAIRQKLKDDLKHYAQKCLKIRTKSGAIKSLKLNDAQLYIHAEIEDQLSRTGRVRVLILKGRQQGSSTYVEARLYHKVTHKRGVRAYILTHEDEATKNIFEMAERYHEQCPTIVKPSTGASNTKELHFDRLDSGYRVGTARTKAGGRSATLQYFHGSEVAYWPNAKDHLGGVLQGVPDEDDTEVILESTSAGAQGEFHRLCMEAHRGEGSYKLIFVPWFWQSEYTINVRRKFKRSSEEEALRVKFKLNDGQLAWRRRKIMDLGSVYTFRREYPNTVEEAFAVEKPHALWKRKDLEHTRVFDHPPLVRRLVGVDPPSKIAECGIVIGGISASRELYLLDDRSKAGPPEEWAMIVVRAFIDHNCDAIIYEENQGGDMVASVIRTAWKKLHGNDRAPLINRWASKSKGARAEPISLLWTDTGQRSGHIVGSLAALEDELCTWEPNSGMESPNRLDAAVWVGSELLNSGPTGTPDFGSQPTEGSWGEDSYD